MYMMSEARRVNEMAREMFLRDGEHRPVMLVFMEGVEGAGVFDIAPFMGNHEGKDLLAAMVRKMAQDNVLTAVVMITEAWMACAGKDDKDLERVQRGEVSVSDLATKKEVLMVKAERLLTG